MYHFFKWTKSLIFSVSWVCCLAKSQAVKANHDFTKTWHNQIVPQCYCAIFRLPKKKLLMQKPVLLSLGRRACVYFFYVVRKQIVVSQWTEGACQECFKENVCTFKTSFAICWRLPPGSAGKEKLESNEENHRTYVLCWMDARNRFPGNATQPRQ